MLVRPHETVFAPFADPSGVDAYYQRVAELEGSTASEFGELYPVVADSRIFDDKAVEFAEQEGMTWQEFVLRGLDIAGMHLSSRHQGREFRRRLGMGHTCTREIIGNNPPEFYAAAANY